MEEHRSDFASDREFEQTVNLAASEAGRRRFQPRSTEALDPASLNDVPVIVGDEVGRYCLGLGQVDIADSVSVLAPPFDRFFVDFEKVDNPIGLHSWGLLVEPFGGLHGGDDDTDVGWHLMLTLIIERDKNRPVGPVARFLQPLDWEGRWMRQPSGEPVWAGYLPRLEPENPPPDVEKETLDGLNWLLFPALMAISFTHCRNVTAREVDPPLKLSHNWERKRGRPLTRYHVLDIAPMREQLEAAGGSTAEGLPQAMHICRGHFKTFTQDSPLFGRTTGQFWWADHVRGNADIGHVTKDYNVTLDEGAAYRAADEAAAPTPPLRTAESDPDTTGAALRAHNATQNLLASAVLDAGLTPRSPSSDQPAFDLAWRTQSRLVVAEVKSLTEKNEERQLRLAVGQVLRYCQILDRSAEVVQAFIAVEREPSDPGWLELCEGQGILLAWPEIFDLAVGGLADLDSA